MDDISCSEQSELESLRIENREKTKHIGTRRKIHLANR